MDKKNIIFIGYGILNGKNRTQYQRAMILSQEYSTYFFCQKKVCKEISDVAACVHTCPGQKYKLDNFIFPFWVILKVLTLNKNIKISAIYTTYHSLATITGYLLQKKGHKWISDIWDYPGLRTITSKTYKSPNKKLQYYYSLISDFFARRFLKNADLFIITLAPGALKKFNINPEKTHYLTNGIDLNIKYPDPKKNEVKNTVLNIIYVGHVRKNRGIDVVIKSAEILLKQITDFKVILVGPVDEIEDKIWIKKTIQKKGLAKNIILTGELPHKKVIWLINHSDFCLYPFPKTEELDYIYPIKIFEYLRMGKVVISADLKGVQKIITHNETGVFFEPGNSDDLARHILRISNDKRLMAKIEKNAVLRSEEFSWESINKKVINIINNNIR